MGYWKLFFRILIVLVIISAISYGITYFWVTIIFKDPVTMFNWMWNFIVILAVFMSIIFSDIGEEYNG